MDRSPVELQRRVLLYAKELAGSRPKGRSGEALLKFAGTVDKESAQQMREAIEDGCERVDTDEW